MKSKKIIGILLVAAVLLSGCNNGGPVQTSAGSTETSQTAEKIVFTESEPETSATESKEKFEFNPHVYSAQLAKSVPQEYWDALYNLCDAIRAGESTFKCASEEAYKWSTDDTILCCLFPAAGLKVKGESDDGSPAFENGTGKISYKMPADEYAKRQAEFEIMITDIINSTVEPDDTDYEKALKLYLYVAENYTYEYEVVQWDNYVYKTFMKKTGQCINFAAVYAYLLMQVGVDGLPCGTYDGMCHAWTYVTINGKGYHIDTTWALKDCYPGVENVYIDYFMMSDAERNSDNCIINDLTVDILPGYWVSRSNVAYAATDNSYNIRSYCGFISLDEDNKILHYKTMEGELKEFHYDI